MRASTWRTEPVDVLEEGLTPGQALRLESQRGQRGAQAVGEIGQRLALGGDQVVETAGELVEGRSGVGDLRGPRRFHPGVQIAAGDAAGRPGQGGHRPHQGAPHAVGKGDARRG